MLQMSQEYISDRIIYLIYVIHIREKQQNQEVRNIIVNFSKFINDELLNNYLPLRSGDERFKRQGMLKFN